MERREHPSSVLSVLLVEPDPPVLEPLLKGTSRFAVTRVHGRSEARQELDRSPYDIVLVDLGPEGARSLAVLRHPAPQSRPPIVAVVDSPDLRQALAAVQGGACDVLVRGEVDSAILVRSLHEAARRRRLSSDLPAAGWIEAEAGGVLDAGSFLEAVSAALDHAAEGGTIVLLLRPRWEGPSGGTPRGWHEAQLHRLAAGLRGLLDDRHEVAWVDHGCLAVLLRDPGTPEEAAGLVRQVREALAALVAGVRRVALGAAIHPRDGRTAPALLDAADRALWLFEKISAGAPPPARAVQPPIPYPHAAGLPAAATLEISGGHRS